MGLLTFEQIKSEIASHHAGRNDIEPRLNTVVDLAQMRVARLHDWDQLKLTVMDTLSVTASIVDDKIYDLNQALPDGYRMKTLYSIRVLNQAGRSQKLSGKTTMQFDTEIPEPEFYARGFPEMFTQFSSVLEDGTTRLNPALELWRVPDQPYNVVLRMQVWPLFLTDGFTVDDDKSIFMLDDALIHLATSYLYNSFGREDKARHHFGIYASVIADALKLDETDFDTVIAGVSVRDGTGVGDYVSDPFTRVMP